MTRPEIVDLLSAHETLGAAGRTELEWLAAHGTHRDLAEGHILTSKGAQVEGLFVVLSGQIGIFVDRGAGMKKVME